MPEARPQLAQIHPEKPAQVGQLQPANGSRLSVLF